MKHILVIHYSQTGQLTEIVNNIVSPLDTEHHQVDYYKIEMEKPFPFPWKKSEFFAVFPETFLEIPDKIHSVPQAILNKKYDLIILGYQVWYLSPSIPINSFLKTPEAKKILANTPVVTVIGCRNMWIMAQEKMKKKLKPLEANLVGNIVLVDRHINHISVITIVHWMFTGKKERFLGVFPKPGVSQKDINESVNFGTIISNHLKENNLSHLQDALLKEDAVKIKPFLITTDKRASIIFAKWAKLIQSKGDQDSPNRLIWIKFFNYYLLFAIWVMAPIVFIFFLITYLFSINKINKDKLYYSSVKLIE
ncbi:dialkylresorcinol condensing enzyme DarA [Mariniflexile gromovii]|uniref:Dialkylresorcinol condensing enzyme DarA n=1 Tax=Mariniflexile gromovii TaxID=362523 RepID=A0ABS4BXB8_9FLAO|nr:dialkylrecorsinol condensing enzyme DarA [Mariniflexile gromovii]MBP0905244.1 dialkylresorcinol condensing enzyme DarA [Mariniflexile gromovii]